MISVRAFAFALSCALVVPGFASAAVPAASAPVGAPSASRNDYANAAFSATIESGLKLFYSRQFKAAEAQFADALKIIPDNTFAISFLNASAAQQEGELDVLTNREEDVSSSQPKDYALHVRLGFSYLFASLTGRDRTSDAREELDKALALRPNGSAAHDGMGILRYNDRSANLAKLQLLAALATDPNDVLAREYLGQLYQTDLRDPVVGLRYVIDVPNLVPGYADIQFHIGSLLFDLKEYDAALPYLQRGLALDVDHVGEAGRHGATLMARIYIAQGKYAAAKSVLNTTIADDVDAIYARTLLKRIDDGDYGASPSPKAT